MYTQHTISFNDSDYVTTTVAYSEISGPQVQFEAESYSLQLYFAADPKIAKVQIDWIKTVLGEVEQCIPDQINTKK